MAGDRIKLADVARLSGVSMTSASMALSDSPRVAKSTRERVHQAAAQLGYVPHFAASALRSSRADSIAVVVPHDTRHVFSHPYFIDLLEGVLNVSNENDISMILSTAQTASDESSAYSRILRGRRASGVIVAGRIHDGCECVRPRTRGVPGCRGWSHPPSAGDSHCWNR